MPPTQIRQRIPPKNITQLFHCIFVFNPATDRIILKNLDNKSVTFKTFAKKKMPAKLGLEGKGFFTPRFI